MTRRPSGDSTRAAIVSVSSCVVASTPIDLARVLGLARRRLSGTPVALYMHESQVAYPPGPKGGRATAAMAADLAAMYAADRVLVASSHHQTALAERLPAFEHLPYLDCDTCSSHENLMFFYTFRTSTIALFRCQFGVGSVLEFA